MLSFDAITAMFWSNTYGQYNIYKVDPVKTDIQKAASKEGPTSYPLCEPTAIPSAYTLCRATTARPAFCKSSRRTLTVSSRAHRGSLHPSIPFAQLSTTWNALLKRLFHFTHGSKHVQNFSDMVRHLVTQRIACPPATPDLFSSIPITPTEKRREPVPIHEILAECATMLDAGNDTTQTSLANAMYHLALFEGTQRNLRSVLEATLPQDAKPVASYQQLQHIPYLRAVLDESFRCRAPVKFGLPRRTTEPTRIAGHLIPADVGVSVPLSALHHNSELSSEPMAFIPERWIAESGVYDDERVALKEYVLPFSLGPRACIGRNLAYMELSIVVAALVLAFEWKLDEDMHGDGKGMEIVERLNANPKELWMCARPRAHEV